MPKEKSRTLEKKKTTSNEVDKRKAVTRISGKAEKWVAFIFSNTFDTRWVGVLFSTVVLQVLCFLAWFGAQAYSYLAA